jgi:hypothetical protein
MQTDYPIDRRKFLAASAGSGIGATPACPALCLSLAPAQPENASLEAWPASDTPKVSRLAAGAIRDSATQRRLQVMKAA